MTYNLNEIALIAEVFGGIAILISLIFVGIQFKENTKATKSANATATMAAMANWYFAIGNNSESSKLYYNFMADPDAMTPEQRFQAVMSTHGVFIIFQNSFYLSKEGTLDSEMLKSLTSALLGVLNQPGFKFYWEQRKSFFFKDFRVYIEDIIEHGEPINSVYKDVPKE